MQLDRVLNLQTPSLIASNFETSSSPIPEISQAKETPFLDRIPEDIFLSTLYKAGIIDSNGYIIAGQHKLPSSLPQIDPKGAKRIQDFLETRFTVEVVLDERAPALQGSFLLKDLYVYLLSKGAESVLIHGGFVKTVLQDWFQEVFKVFEITDKSIISKLTDSFKKPPPDMDIHLMAPNVGQNDILTLNAEICIFIAQLLVPPKEYARLSLDVKVALRKAIIKALNCKIVEIFPPGEWGSGETCSNTAFEKDGEKVDNLFVLRLKRYHFAILDALSIPITSLIKNPSSDSPIIPESDYVQIWQPIIDRLAKVIHIDDISEIIPKGLIRFVSLLSSGHRCPDRETTSLLFQKFWEEFGKGSQDQISEIIVQHILDHHNSHHSNDYKALIALTFNVLNILLYNHIPMEIVIEIWKKVQNTLPDYKLTFCADSGIWAEAKAPAIAITPAPLHLPTIGVSAESQSHGFGSAEMPLPVHKMSYKDEPNIFLLAANALKNNPQSIKVVLAFLQVLGFIQLQTINSNTVKTSLTKHEEKLCLQISEEHTLLLSTQVMEALDILEKEDKKFDQPFWDLLKPLLSHFLSTTSFKWQATTQLGSHLDTLDFSIGDLAKKASAFLQHPKNSLFIQLGYQLLLACRSLKPDSVNLLLLLEYVPIIFALEKNPAQKETLLENIEQIINHVKPTKKFLALIRNSNPDKKSIYLEWIKSLICSGNQALIGLSLQMLEKSPLEQLQILLKSLDPIPATIASQLFTFAVRKKGFNKEGETKAFIEVIAQFPNDFISFKDIASKVVEFSDPSCSDQLIEYISGLYFADPSPENFKLLVKATKTGSIFAQSLKVAEAWLKISSFYLQHSHCEAGNLWEAWKTAIDKGVAIPSSPMALLFLSELCEKLYSADDPKFEDCLNMLCQDCENSKWNADDLIKEISTLLTKNIPQAIFIFQGLLKTNLASQDELTRLFQTIIQHCRETSPLNTLTLKLLYKVIEPLLNQKNQSTSSKGKPSKRSGSVPKISDELTWIMSKLLEIYDTQSAIALLKISKHHKIFSPQNTINHALKTCQMLLDKGDILNAANAWIETNQFGIWDLSAVSKEQEQLFLCLCKKLFEVPEGETPLKTLLNEAKKYTSDTTSKDEIREIISQFAKKSPEKCEEFLIPFLFLFNNDQLFNLLIGCMESLLTNSNISKFFTPFLNLSKIAFENIQKQRLITLLNLSLEKNTDLKKDFVESIKALIDHPDFDSLFDEKIETQLQFLISWAETFFTRAQKNEKGSFFQAELSIHFIKKILELAKKSESQESNLLLIQFFFKVIEESSLPVLLSQKKAIDDLPKEFQPHLSTILSLFKKEKQSIEILHFLNKLHSLAGDFPLSKTVLEIVLEASIEILKDNPNNHQTVHKVLLNLKGYSSNKLVPELQIKTYIQLITCLIEENSEFAKLWLQKLFESFSLKPGQLLSEVLLQWLNKFCLNKDFDFVEYILEKHKGIPKIDLANFLDKFINDIFKSDPVRAWNLFKKHEALLQVNDKKENTALAKLFIAFFFTKPNVNLERAWELVKKTKVLESGQLVILFEHLSKSSNSSAKKELLDMFEKAESEAVFLPKDYIQCAISLIKTPGTIPIETLLRLLDTYPQKTQSPEISSELLYLFLELLLDEILKIEDQEKTISTKLIKIKGLLFLQQKNMTSEPAITGHKNLSMLIEAAIIEINLKKNTQESFDRLSDHFTKLFEEKPLARNFPKLITALLKVMHLGIQLCLNSKQPIYPLSIDQLFKTLQLIDQQLLYSSPLFQSLLKICAQSSNLALQAITQFFFQYPLDYLPHVNDFSAFYKEMANIYLQHPVNHPGILRQLMLPNLKSHLSSKDRNELMEKVIITELEGLLKLTSPDASLKCIELFKTVLPIYELNPEVKLQGLTLAIDHLHIVYKYNKDFCYFIGHFVDLIRITSSCEVNNPSPVMHEFKSVENRINFWLSSPSERNTYPFMTPRMRETEGIVKGDASELLSLAKGVKESRKIEPNKLCFDNVWIVQKNPKQFIESLAAALEHMILITHNDQSTYLLFRFIIHSNLEYLIDTYPEDFSNFKNSVVRYWFRNNSTFLSCEEHFCYTHTLGAQLRINPKVKFLENHWITSFKLGLLLTSRSVSPDITLINRQKQFLEVKTAITSFFELISSSKDTILLAVAINVMIRYSHYDEFEINYLDCYKFLIAAVSENPNAKVTVVSPLKPNSPSEVTTLINHLENSILYLKKCKDFPLICNLFLNTSFKIESKETYRHRLLQFLNTAFNNEKFESRYEYFYKFLLEVFEQIIGEITPITSLEQSLKKYDMEIFFRPPPTHTLTKKERLTRAEALNMWLKYLLDDRLIQNDKSDVVIKHANELFNNLKNDVYRDLQDQLKDAIKIITTALAKTKKYDALYAV